MLLTGRNARFRDSTFQSNFSVTGKMVLVNSGKATIYDKKNFRKKEEN